MGLVLRWGARLLLSGDARKEFRELFRTYSSSSRLLSGLMQFRQGQIGDRSGHLAEVDHGIDDYGFELFGLHRCVVTDRIN